jgi:biotin transport system ATP-binding protein
LNKLFSVNNLSKTFSNGFTALNNISLEIYEGQCLLIAGSNGSGKTLLMQILTGLTEQSSGEVLFRGKPLHRALGEMRRSTGIVFQDADAQIIGETVAEDISLGAKYLKLPKTDIANRLESALKEVGLEEKRDFPPRKLSGGEKRRLAVAGIIAMGCETIIMDEPFSNLDFPGVVSVVKIIERLKSQAKNVIILTHELEKVLALAERLVIIHKGSVKDSGDPMAVLDRLNADYGVRNPLCAYKNVGDCVWR